MLPTPAESNVMRIDDTEYREDVLMCQFPGRPGTDCLRSCKETSVILCRRISMRGRNVRNKIPPSTDLLGYSCSGPHISFVVAVELIGYNRTIAHAKIVPQVEIHGVKDNTLIFDLEPELLFGYQLNVTLSRKD